jgi:hypothetical protein
VGEQIRDVDSEGPPHGDGATPPVDGDPAPVDAGFDGAAGVEALALVGEGVGEVVPEGPGGGERERDDGGEDAVQVPGDHADRQDGTGLSAARAAVAAGPAGDDVAAGARDRGCDHHLTRAGSVTVEIAFVAALRRSGDTSMVPRTFPTLSLRERRVR